VADNTPGAPARAHTGQIEKSYANIVHVGYMSRAFDRLPSWAKIILALAGLGCLIYGFATEGPMYLIKAIFSPEF
jgi:hypothetical protein